MSSPASSPQRSESVLSDAETVPKSNLTIPMSTENTKPSTPVAPPSTDIGSSSDAPNVSESAKKKKDRTKMNREKLIKYLNKAEKDLTTVKENLKIEKEAKKKLYSSLVKLANELKKSKVDSAKDAEEPSSKPEADTSYSSSLWYEGGLWRSPELLPGLTEYNGTRSRGFREEISFTDLFLDLVVVTAFSRVGTSIKDYGISWPSLAFFVIFLQMWRKETAYATRFDNTDLSSTLGTLLNSFAILFGSISANTDTFGSDDSTRIMMVAAFAALVNVWLHMRVVILFKNRSGVEHSLATKYACSTVGRGILELGVWYYGINFVEAEHRWIIFLVGIILSKRISKTFLPNDFHAATTKRGVLFILLLGFNLQSLVTTASPFFDYSNSPTSNDYLFIGAACLLLFCIKLLYCDEFTNTNNPSDHALLVNWIAGLFFDIGEVILLISTTILGGGLDLLTHSYLAATAALPSDQPKELICLGFGGTILSIAFIKSLSVIRVPTDRTHRKIFFFSHGIQLLVILVSAFVSFSIAESDNVFVLLQLNDMELLCSITCLALLLLVITWIDKAIELSLIGSDEVSSYRVHPFGFWWCLRSEADKNEDLFAGRHPSVRASVSSDRIHLLGGDRNDVYEAINQSERHLKVNTDLIADDSEHDMLASQNV